MRYKLFGNTGMEVSEMALGTWGIGGAGWDDRPEEMRLDAIRAAVELGVNFIDTAPAYNAGAAEKLVGQAIHTMGCREKVFIATKCGNEFIDGQYVRCGRPENILRECEESLQNLQTDYIDLYLIHWPDERVHFSETMGAINELKAQGKVRHVGVSNFSREQIEQAGQHCPIEAIQVQYSMVARDNEPLMKWAAARGMGVMTYGSLGGGILSGAIRQARVYDPMDSRSRFYKHFQEPMFSRIMELLKVMDGMSAARGGTPLSQFALNWAARKDFVSTCIVGAQSRPRVAENTAAFDWSLTADEAAALDAAIARHLTEDA